MGGLYDFEVCNPGMKPVESDNKNSLPSIIPFSSHTSGSEYLLLHLVAVAEYKKRDVQLLCTLVMFLSTHCLMYIERQCIPTFMHCTTLIIFSQGRLLRKQKIWGKKTACSGHVKL